MATSKQPKQPAFPHPPLETGVAQYPTPLVPNYNDKKGGWGINEQGHIILLEKISIEKGNFTPLPLDGSITYTGRDANKWPSTLYLVAERPTPDGEFCYRFWANDRSLASQDLWNYGSDYSANNPGYPITSRTYIVPRKQYEPVALGSIDPVFGGNQIIAQQKMLELPDDNPLQSRYVSVQRVYETIPGPILTGERLDSRGDIETVYVQTVAAGTAPTADGLYVTETKVDPVDSVKSTKTIASVASYATLTTKVNKAGLQGDISTTDDVVAPGTSPDDLSTTVLESSVEQITATKARKKTTTSTGPTLLGGVAKKDGLLGETTIDQSIVAYGAAADDLSQTVLQSEVTPIDAYKSKKTTITAIGPTTLSGGATKDGLLGITTEVQSIVAAGASPDAVSTTVIQSQVTPIDSAKSKKVTVSSSGPTTLSGGSKKDGLLGEVRVVDSIVAAGDEPDSLTTTVLSSQVTPIDSAKSKKTTITATGPTTLSGGEKKAGLLGITTEEQSIVVAGSAPDDLSATVLESKITPIDSAKSKKTTISSTGPNTLNGAGNKAGLLGETTIEQSIVGYGSNADALSTNVLSSDVEPIDSSKSKKTTVKSFGPTSLSGGSNKSGLLGLTAITESIVSSGASPDSLSDTIISSEVTPIDSAKSKKTTVVSSGPSSLGGVSLQEFGIATTKQSIVDYGSNLTIDEKTIKAEIEPIDLAKSKEVFIEYEKINTISGHQYDDQFQTNLIISKEIIAADAAPVTESEIHEQDGDPYLLSYKDEPVNPYQSQRILVISPELPPDRTEYTTGTYTSPLLVFDLVTESTNLSCDYANADTRIKITPITRASQSGPTIFKNIISYSYGPPDPSDTSLFRPVLKDVSYTGYVINYNIGPALCNRLQSSYTYYYYNNGNVITQTTNQVPVKYCDFLGEPEPIAYESWDISATDISADGYMDLIGTYQKISWESHYWKAGIWQNKEVQVLLF